MKHTPRDVEMQLAHVFQQELFPRLKDAVGPLSPQMQLLTAVASLIPLGRLLSARQASNGRPAKDRAALATASIAKAILNLPTRRDLIGRLRVDESLRRICGWGSRHAVPHESEFSRAGAEFAATELPQQLQEAIVATTQAQRLVGDIARDATAIPARERFPETARRREEKARRKKAKSKRPKGGFVRAKAAERGTRMQRQRQCP